MLSPPPLPPHDHPPPDPIVPEESTGPRAKAAPVIEGSVPSPDGKLSSFHLTPLRRKARAPQTWPEIKVTDDLTDFLPVTAREIEILQALVERVVAELSRNEGA